MRDPHSFGPGDPDITIPRKLATDILENLEMWNDVVYACTGVKDTWLKGCIDKLTAKLTEDDKATT